MRHPRRRLFIAALFLIPAVFLLCAAALALTPPADRVWPAEGGTVMHDGALYVDCSHADLGYVMIRSEQNAKKLKLRITMGDTTYTYDLNGEARYEVFPLQMGSGRYSVTLYENKSGKQYAKKATIEFSAALVSEDAAFLCPSQYVWYTALTRAVADSDTVCAGCDTDQACLDAVSAYVRQMIRYDYIRALDQDSSYLADIDGCLTKGKGLCLDIAAITACMLRVQGIPVRVMVGEVTDGVQTINHAWNEVLIGGTYVRVDLTAELMNRTDFTYTAEKVY